MSTVLEDIQLEEVKRLQSFLELENDIDGLCEMQSEFNTMITTQGESLDHIEDQITTTRDNVDVAVKSLEDAKEYKSIYSKIKMVVGGSVFMGSALLLSPKIAVCMLIGYVALGF